MRFNTWPLGIRWLSRSCLRRVHWLALLFVTLHVLLISTPRALADDTSTLPVSFTSVSPERRDAYVCNLGLLHAPHTQQVCFFRGTTTVCQAGDHNCQCTSNAAHAGDVIRYTTSDGTSTRKHVLVPARDPKKFATAYPETSDVFAADRISDVKVLLGSELYGAKYFLDVCFPPLEIPATDGRGHEIQSWVSNSDVLLSKLSYINLANPRLKLTSSDCQLGSYETRLTGNITPLKWYQKPNEACRVRYLFSEEAVTTPRVWQLHADRLALKVILPLATCTKTQRYWQGHTGGSDAATWNKVEPNGPDSALFDSGLSWIAALSTEPAASPSVPEWLVLAKEWMATQLNWLAGAPTDSIAYELVDARGYVAEWAYLDMKQVVTPSGQLEMQKVLPTAAIRQRMLDLAAVLADYNKGKKGLPLCREAR